MACDSDDIVHGLCHLCGTLLLRVEQSERMERRWAVVDFGGHCYASVDALLHIQSRIVWCHLEGCLVLL